MTAKPSWPWWRFALTGLSVVGLALSAYLAWHHLAGGSAIGCGGGSSCDQVLSSRWSSIAGVLPISGLATGVYLALLVASFFIGPATPTADRRLAWSAMLILSGAAAGSAIWFTIVQKYLIGAFCPYCMATHTTGLLLAILITWQLPKSAEGRVIGKPAALLFPLLGIALAGIMAATQASLTPPATYQSGQSQVALPAFEPRAVPLVGSPTAPHIIALLFDYKCSHCQKLHDMLDEAINRYDGKLAFVLCPSPLDMQCNPYVSKQVDAFRDSCELAKLSLTIWVAKREAFPAFDRWLFTAEPGQAWTPRTIEAARAKAVEFVGQPAFDTARADPWIDRYLEGCVRAYGNSVNPDGTGAAVPKLINGPRWVTPEPNNVDQLLSILQESLGVPKP